MMMPIPKYFRVSTVFGSLATLGMACGASSSPTSWGGTQDMGAFRGIVEAGGIPGTATLDANGFFNEHFIDWPAVTCVEGDPLCARATVALSRDWLTQAPLHTIQVTLASPIDPASLPARARDWVAVIDTSGSMMEDDRIGYVKLGMHTLIDAMAEGDRLALITYSNDVKEWSTLAEPQSKAALHALVDSWNANGATNLHDGLQHGLAIASAAIAEQSEPRDTRVLLLSDGLPTIGIMDNASILSMADSYVRDGIALTTLGVGLDFNLDLMVGLAQRGAGHFYFLEDPSATSEVFLEEMATMFVPIAQDVELSFTPNELLGLSVGTVTGTQFWAGNGNFGAAQIPAVFLASRSSEPGEGRRGGGSMIVIELLGNVIGEGSIALGDLRIRYLDPQGTLHEQSVLVEGLPPTAESDYFSAPAAAKAHALYNLYRGIYAALSDVENRVDFSAAEQKISALIARAQQWNVALEDADIAADIALLEQLRANLQAQGSSYCGVSDGYCEDMVMFCHASQFSESALWLVAVALVVGRAQLRRKRQVTQ